MSMFAKLFSFVTGGGLGGLAKQLAEWDIKRRHAANDEDKIAAEFAIGAIQADIEAARQATEIRKATASYWEVRVMVFTAGFPPALHFAAVCLASMMEQPFIVHKLPAPMDDWQGAIILSFFGLSAVGTGLKVLAWRSRR